MTDIKLSESICDDEIKDQKENIPSSVTESNDIPEYSDEIICENPYLWDPTKNIDPGLFIE